MIIFALVVAGLCLGSFVNALVWRLRQQEELQAKKKKPSPKRLQELSVSKGRSMCPHCRHELAKKDLVPVLSWLWLRGKCRYCRKPISAQYPLVELLMAALFVGSYLFWPKALLAASSRCPQPSLFSGAAWYADLLFVFWLLFLTGLLALLIYDLRWLLLPNRIVYPLAVIGSLMALINIVSSPNPATALLNVVLAVAVGGGIFYLLFQVSKGKWIGGGDVKLGWVLGLVLGTPAKAFLLLFIASLLGTAVSLPLLSVKKLKAKSVIPFGPFLIVAAVIVFLFGSAILHWYKQTFIY